MSVNSSKNPFANNTRITPGLNVKNTRTPTPSPPGPGAGQITATVFEYAIGATITGPPAPKSTSPQRPPDECLNSGSIGCIHDCSRQEGCSRDGFRGERGLEEGPRDGDVQADCATACVVARDTNAVAKVAGDDGLDGLRPAGEQVLGVCEGEGEERGDDIMIRNARGRVDAGGCIAQTVQGVSGDGKEMALDLVRGGFVAEEAFIESEEEDH
ncbi:hypothetical protein GB937_001301 [Aspergillus fischeri]|nr:hypothetical protein GB937_001301 [Aspergillus fischeri]